jgi:hypothetical protein
MVSILAAFPDGFDLLVVAFAKGRETSVELLVIGACDAPANVFSLSW